MRWILAILLALGPTGAAAVVVDVEVYDAFGAAQWAMQVFR